MKYFILFACILTLLESCGSMDKNDRISRRHDFFSRYTSKRELKATTNWKMGDDILILRKNNTFRYYSKVFGIVNSGYYSGTYIKNDNIISFKFYRNYKPVFFKNDTLVIEKRNDCVVLRCKNSTNNYLVIN